MLPDIIMMGVIMRQVYSQNSRKGGVMFWEHVRNDVVQSVTTSLSSKVHVVVS